ncbi:MAG: plasmid pRiA4b ORF-3 family protein [Candidatus Entotheonellia bacterium]
MEHAFTPPNIYQFRVVVQRISPLIWRRLLVRSDMSLATLHATLQIVFAWSDMHLHCFHIHGKEYGSTRLGGPHFDDDPRHVPLADLHLHRGEHFSYVYNFIDHWECELRLEAILPWDPKRHYPVCLGGKWAAPPEDCGGPWAYLQRVDQYHVPLDAMAIVATALDRVLKTDGQTSIRQVIGNPETFREAVDQLDAYEGIKKLGVRPREVPLPAADPGTTAGTPPRVPDSAF